MSAIDIIDTGLVMARLDSVRAVGPSRLHVVWAEGNRAGRAETVDLMPVVGSYKIYRPLRGNAELFETARLIEDGDAVAWRNGEEDIEMSADMIEHVAEQEMSPDDFARFLKRNKLTQDAAGALLGRSRRQIGYYLERGPVPRIVALACAGYEALAARAKKQAA
jgi:hypothetical protein